MERTKKKTKGYEAILRGSVCALMIYLLGILFIAFLVTKGALPQESAFMALSADAVVAVFCGALVSVRKSTMRGLAAAMLTSCLIACVMIMIGLCFRQGISWMGQGGVLLLCVFAGGVLAAWFGRKKSRSGKRLKK